MKEDYFVRYGNENKTNRTEYTTLEKARKEFEKMKLDSSITWAELIHEPIEEEDAQILIDEFEKQIVDFLGKKVVINIG